MIKFFRTFRQKLLSRGQRLKYVKYMLGEILLIVFGILIALQINNWNEQRKDNKQEVLLLNQIYSDVNTNLSEVVELTRRLNINKLGIDSLIARLDRKHYDLMFPVYMTLTIKKSDFNYSSSGYNLIQTGKATLISDEAVLKSILNLYENDLPDITDRQSDMRNSIEYIQRHFINKLFVKASNDLNIQFKEFDVVASDLYVPVDFNSLSENTEFQNTIYQLGELIEARLAYLRNTENELKKTSTLVTSTLSQE